MEKKKRYYSGHATVHFSFKLSEKAEENLEKLGQPGESWGPLGELGQAEESWGKLGLEGES